MTDSASLLAQRVADAYAQQTPLHLRGAGTKDFLGAPRQGAVLSLAEHAGVLDYDPTELVISARCGTPLTALESTLAQARQMLPFEPPRFTCAGAPGGTLGGALAAGLSGPRRPYGGAVRDHVLGLRMINGQGHILSFGGQVMKNVAGYDISRLQVGAMGTLGVILDAAIKVLPQPPACETRVRALDAAQAIQTLNAWAARPLPITAAAHWRGLLHIRLAGAPAAIAAAGADIGGDIDPQGQAFWAALRDQTHPFFAGDPVWRLSVPDTTPPLDLPGDQFIDWGGAQRWYCGDADAAAVLAAARAAGGHAHCWRGDPVAAFGPAARLDQPQPLRAIAQRLKQAFDPADICNRGVWFDASP